MLQPNKNCMLLSRLNRHHNHKMKPLQADFQTWSTEIESDDKEKVPYSSSPATAAPSQHNGAVYRFEQKGCSWYVISEVPTDVAVQVQDTTFHVHKQTMLSKSGYIGRTAHHPPNTELGYNIKFEKFPGGPNTFELVLRFCYGVPINLSASNVAQLRCASEYLEMTEEFDDGNLISKTEAFLTFIVLASWKDTIIVLKSCENLSPWAENLQIVRRCCDSISSKIYQEKSAVEDTSGDESWWIGDVATLRIDHFTRILAALKAKGVESEIIGSCIVTYADKWLPAMDAELQKQRSKGHGNGKKELQLSISSLEETCGHNKEHKLILESLISALPTKREAIPCDFLLWMLKMAMVYSVTPVLISELEKKVGEVLEDAQVKDLLIPNCENKDQNALAEYSSSDERTMHNIDVVQRIVEYFLMHEQLQEQQQLKFERFNVSKLLDNYLAEIAKDPNLTIIKFQVLAEALPDNARACHDGIYRAIDIYLKSHPTLSEQERRRLCKIMNCKKLSLDACMHAAQNDRLPLKTVLQVLFSEQMKLRAALQGKEQTSSDNCEQEEIWSSTNREVKILKDELEKVKGEMVELQRDYAELQRKYEKLNEYQRNNSSWSLGWKKIRRSSLFSRKLETDGSSMVKIKRRLSTS